MNPTNLQEFKEIKKLKVIIDDLQDVIKILNLTTKALGLFKKYKPIQNILIEINQNKKILEIHLNKYREMLNNGELEKTQK